jgi:5'-nucleotidase/UDP-sugar diphosphatase
MRNLVIVLCLVLVAAVAQAGVISDLQQGMYTIGDEITVTNAIVTGATYNGCFITELPVGPYSGVWVYLGSGHAVVDGDVVNIVGLYEEYYDLTEINASGGLVEVVGNGPVPAGYPLTAAEFVADSEPFEGVAICITDGLTVTVAPNSYGEWFAQSVESGDEIMFDDFWYDDTTVTEAQCFNYACGPVYYSFGAYKLEAWADGIEVVDCAVPTDASSLTDIKAMFR